MKNKNKNRVPQLDFLGLASEQAHRMLHHPLEDLKDIIRFNWAFQDSYPPFRIIQGGFVFSLYLVHRKARRFIDAHDLGYYFIKAFPAILSEAEVIRALDPSDTVCSMPHALKRESYQQILLANLFVFLQLLNGPMESDRAVIDDIPAVAELKGGLHILLSQKHRQTR